MAALGHKPGAAFRFRLLADASQSCRQRACRQFVPSGGLTKGRLRCMSPATIRIARWFAPSVL